ncbi:NlpC/P60 family protein [Williamsia muralis]|uniref:NlpC/P60 family protein n=1 Tax=Williamsia marianensis TaxID=85044 RepID=UPI00380063BA
MAVAFVAAVAVGFGQLSAGTAVAEPPSSADKIATLINQIADTNQNLVNLDGDVAVKREAVNRALVDLQNAREAQRLAAIAVRGAQEALQGAAGAIALAETDFDGFIRSLYTQGNSQGSMAAYLSGDPGAVLDRASVIDQLSRDQQETITRLQQARNEEANRAATAQATEQQASFAATTAENRQADAQSAITEAIEAVKAENARRQKLQADRDEAQRQLEALRGQPTPVTSPGAPGSILPDQQAAIEDQAHQAALRAAADAAGKLALNTSQQMLAALVGSLTPPHTDIDEPTTPTTPTTPVDPTDPTTPVDPTDPTTPVDPTTPTEPTTPTTPSPGTVDPGAEGPAAVEIVVNRAMSQLGVSYSWGGGDANGPTLGIRDGGVADSYGDYNKVGFDCSGLMIYAFAGIGISLPHYTGYQYTSGPQFPLSEMQRGDMIFYGPNASQHVALYLGDNTMIEAPQSGDVVKISPLRTSGAMPYVVRLA